MNEEPKVTRDVIRMLKLVYDRHIKDKFKSAYHSPSHVLEHLKKQIPDSSKVFLAEFSSTQAYRPTKSIVDRRHENPIRKSRAEYKDPKKSRLNSQSKQKEALSPNNNNRYESAYPHCAITGLAKQSGPHTEPDETYNFRLHRKHQNNKQPNNNNHQMSLENLITAERRLSSNKSSTDKLRPFQDRSIKQFIRIENRGSESTKDSKAHTPLRHKTEEPCGGLPSLFQNNREQYNILVSSQVLSSCRKRSKNSQHVHNQCKEEIVSYSCTNSMMKLKKPSGIFKALNQAPDNKNGQSLKKQLDRYSKIHQEHKNSCIGRSTNKLNMLSLLKSTERMLVPKKHNYKQKISLFPLQNKQGRNQGNSVQKERVIPHSRSPNRRQNTEIQRSSSKEQQYSYHKNEYQVDVDDFKIDGGWMTTSNKNDKVQVVESCEQLLGMGIENYKVSREPQSKSNKQKTVIAKKQISPIEISYQKNNNQSYFRDKGGVK